MDIYSTLLAQLEPIRQKLQERANQLQGKSNIQLNTTDKSQSNSTHLSECSTLNYLCHRFNLSQFEREIILLCVGMELDPLWPSECAGAQVNPQYNFPTFSLAQSIFERVDTGAFAPESPLRYWKLIQVEPGLSLTLSPLKIDERIFHFLVGTNQLDERLISIIKPVVTNGTLVNSHQEIVNQIISVWNYSLNPTDNLFKSQNLDSVSSLFRKKVTRNYPELSKFEKEGDDLDIHIKQGLHLPIIQLYGNETSAKIAIAATVCYQLELKLYKISSQVIPTNLNELYQLIKLWRREARLSQATLFLEVNQVTSIDISQENAITYFIEEIDSPLIVSRQDRKPQQHRQVITFEVNKPTTLEQRHTWHQTFREQKINLDGFVDRLVAQFNFSATEIHSISQQISPLISSDLSLESADQNKLITQKIWHICRDHAQPQMDELAQPIQAVASWDDLVLPELQKQTLQNIATHVKQRITVYEHWGFVQKGKRGLGITALFAGASGTGKTMAAEVIARELRLDLYRIDLSSVVSKYIGETEKNLRQVFDKAETGGAILLFDEADALFGKRSDVKDSRDRYANLEVSYLLQRMEAYRGLAILTTNLKEAIDNAFMRRIRFVVKFPLPDVTQRTEIWRRIFPKETPTAGLDFRKLAKLNLPGGNIRNIALNAAFLAADLGEPVTMAHLLQATESEYAKLERPLTDTEVKGWV
ncbi:ATP-binding protein [Dapis sp. BLCC M229]|uniref:ATP-binding protein n=1 Tax=Dapis sp. BLCC M229 TaxID=3400188 RepID=UPI003CF67804